MLRDLGRTAAKLRGRDALESDEVRIRPQETPAESARELAAVALTDGELTFEPGVRDVHRTDGPVPVG